MLPTVEAVAARAQTVRPARALLYVLLAPFLLVGLIAGVVWALVAFAWAATVEGFAAGRKVSPDAGRS